MAHQAGPPVLEPFPGKGVHERGQFRVDRLFDQLARSIAQDVSESYAGKWVTEFEKAAYRGG